MNDYQILKTNTIERQLRDSQNKRRRVFNPSQNKKRWGFIGHLLNSEGQLQEELS